MALRDLLDDARQNAGERAWGAAVRLAREGAVQGVSDDGDEVRLRVKGRRRALPHEVFLWPGEADWGCDCELPGDPCVHVCAALIALNQGRSEGQALPVPRREYQVVITYAFTSERDALRVERRIRWPDGRSTPMDGALADSKVLASRQDVQAESLLALMPAGPLAADAVRRLLRILEGQAEATLDGEPVQLSADTLSFRVKVTDEGDGFKVGLFRPRGPQRWYRGAALTDGVIRPTTYGQLTRDQRRFLVRGVTFTPDEVGRLVGDYLPRLRERIPVDVETERLPHTQQLVPMVEVTLAESVGGLEVQSRLVYGDPPVAVVKHGKLQALGDVVPGRDLAAERAAARAYESTLGLPVGMRQVLAPSRAAVFLREELPLYEGPVRSSVSAERFRVVDSPVTATVAVAPHNGRFRLDVLFENDEGRADPHAVLRAWSSGRSLVPLLDGGYAMLPLGWLESHGGVLREILEARSADGTVDRHATAALVELLEDTRAEVPPDLQKLRAYLEGEGGLPELALPARFEGELRHYQEAGVRWLGFLRRVDLQGILADDMGLGKTVQALVAMAQTDGPHLVVAPTSVLRNWAREAERFLPGTEVNVYHGPARTLGPLNAGTVVLTSYALLRLDLEQLRQHEWGYAVLDEAQAIKNPRSQTARSAGKLRARHRLCLTGTPVENRLEELWSLFRFLMPGFLGSLEAFRERFSIPIEASDPNARKALRNRIRPYVLRRMKSQVAKELPALTEMTIRCEMTPAQRRVYEAVRHAAWVDVQQALGAGPQNMMHVLEALLRMRQACCDPTLLPGDHSDVPSCKLDELEDLLVELVCEDHKALLFSQWTSLLDRVELRLEKLGIRWVRLDGSTRNRQDVIDAFQDPSGPPVFLLSLKAGGTGLNLTAADYVVHLDPWWNPAVQQQATDRAHRIGQDKPVVSVKLIAEGSVEERILELQDAKRALADAALGTEGGFLKALTATELRSLFEPPGSPRTSP